MALTQHQQHIQAASDNFITVANFATGITAATSPAWLPAVNEVAAKWTTTLGGVLLILQILWMVRKILLALWDFSKGRPQSAGRDGDD